MGTNSLGINRNVRLTGMNRKLRDVGRDLVSLGKQGKVEGFFSNTENAGKLSSLVEEIRDAMMEYQAYGSITRLCNV